MPLRAQKFAVVGCSCSGKTTLSKAIALRYSIKAVHIDEVHWMPGWKERPREETRKIIDEATAGDSWVIDGSYSRLHDLTLNRANSIIWLNLPLHIVFGRSISRTLVRIIKGDEVFPGCKESFREAFMSFEGIPWWVLTTWKKRRDQYRMIFENKTFGNKEYVELRSTKDISTFLEDLPR